MPILPGMPRVPQDPFKVKMSFNRYHVVPKLNSADDPSVQAVVKTIRSAAQQMGCIEVGAVDVGPTTLVFAVGGDGTMLQAMRIAASNNATAVGINLGRIGFLTEIDSHRHLAHAISAALRNGADTVTEERLLLTTSLKGAMPACNEISVSQLYADSLITYHLNIGYMSAGIHRANGLLLSTPTGSTAYALSVGGALMMPEMDAIQIIPVAPATMTSRPIIVPANAPITLRVWGGEITVRADGQIVKDAEEVVAESWTPTKDDPYELTVTAYENRAKVLHFTGWNFFDVLTEKLGWKHE